ncbi:MAG: cellulase family glycosylhydrolase [Saprospiraceae bacterium]
MKIIFIFLSWLILISFANAQHKDQIFIDEGGIMRWSRDNSEVKGFGENYTVPFAYGFRAAKRMGVNLKAAIDQDVYQFARLGLDLYRVHVWDCEISDTLGNLLDNEHLELFDYLLWKLKQKGINAIITPIAYWGNGWPEKDEPTPGFSTKYDKDQCLINPDAIKAQENYLKQFVNHVNKYTGIAYKSDPQILAFEICNEPHHKGTPAEVTSFVKKMKDAIKSTSCTKPVFYNVSHRVHLEQAYFDAGIDGGTFQWYPTGLGFQKELGGNMLPNVDKYEIPFNDVLKKNHAARIVYEFDAADMATSYMYPAMARSFRTAGMQLATHFAWDPTYTAPYNTEYNTHFMNLFYAPQKALGLMICGEIFRTMPLYKDYGTYPANTSFGPFRVSYEEKLAEMVTDKKFIYTNNTNSKPPAPEKLELIAGYGNSPLIQYTGTGAYFFDKLGEGMWKLELMPDAVVVDNLFGQNDLSIIRAVVKYERQKMNINLPGIGNEFSIESLDWRDSILYRETRDGSVDLKPGTYLILNHRYGKEDSITFYTTHKIVLKDSIPFPQAPDIMPTNTSSMQSWNMNFTEVSTGPILLFEASTQFYRLNRQWIRGSGLEPPPAPGIKSQFHLKLNGLAHTDDENPNAAPVPDYTIRHYFGDIVAPRKNDIAKKKSILFKGHAIGDDQIPVQISLVMKDGSAFGGMIELNSKDSSYVLPLSILKPVKAVLLPRPYPTFLPYYSSAKNSGVLDMNQVESLEFSIGPGIKEEDWGKTYEMMISEIWLQ